MPMNLPFENLIPDQGTILIAGMGGGFDVFCGLPIYFELRRRGYEAHLGSLSFAALRDYIDGEWLSQTLVGIDSGEGSLSGYHPERFLARWFRDEEGRDIQIWCFEATGTKPLLADYQLLAARLRLDCVVLIDGGVDSLMRGDEEWCGSLQEDYLSLSAVCQLDEVPVRLLACIGAGVECDVSHGRFLENVA